MTETQPPRRLPVWVLSPRQEKEARQNLKAFAYGQCDEYVKAMVECSKLHGLKVFPACDSQRDKMAKCILSYQGDNYLDQERDKIVQRKISKMEEQLRQQEVKK